MTKGTMLKWVHEAAEEAAVAAGCELVDVEFVKEGAYWYLRVYIDKEGGVSLDDCEAVNGPVSAILDEKDPIEQAYFLEVSSPGLERPLKTARDFDKALGKPITLKLYKTIDGAKQCDGVLKSYENGIIHIETESGETKSFADADVGKAHLKLIL